jgi:NAD(P)-dependent dehydrogenase (short-subunit alcohol dehydrogenase family)
MRLEEKTAIVTGAAHGIGRAIAQAFSAEAANLVLVDLDGDGLKTTADAISDQGGHVAHLTGDVALEQTARDAVGLACKKFGGLTTLVSNAVYDLPYEPVTAIALDDWNRTMDVNLTAAYLLAKHAIPEMEKAGAGAIVLVASQLGQVARPGRPWYCAQKGGLIALAKAMALDHADQNIRVNSLSPGPVETGRFIRNIGNLEDARANPMTLLGRLGRPEEIAPAAVFLASDEASFMTGSDLVIDGGYTAV